MHLDDGYHEDLPKDRGERTLVLHTILDLVIEKGDMVCGMKSPATGFQPCTNTLGPDSIILDNPEKTSIFCGRCFPKCLKVRNDTLVIKKEEVLPC